MEYQENAVRPCSRESATCISVGSECADVHLPISLHPTADVGEIEAECCGDPKVIVRTECGCTCEITVIQTVCYHIPIEYGATAQLGNLFVHCKKGQPHCE